MSTRSSGRSTPRPRSPHPPRARKRRRGPRAQRGICRCDRRLQEPWPHGHRSRRRGVLGADRRLASAALRCRLGSPQRVWRTHRSRPADRQLCGRPGRVRSRARGRAAPHSRRGLQAPGAAGRHDPRRGHRVRAARRRRADRARHMELADREPGRRTGFPRNDRGARPRARGGGRMILEGKRLLITGVVTRHSIAWEVARQAQEAGAEVVLTGFGRARRMTERAGAKLPHETDVLELDVNSDDDLAALASELTSRWGGLDGVLHAIAFAPGDALGGGFLDTPTTSALTAFQTSAVSLKTLTAPLLPLLERSENGASVVGLDFDASVAWPAYDWMGVAKAGLEAVARYLARDVGPRKVRVNLVAAGPLRTAAASGIEGFSSLARAWEHGAPLGWDPDDAGPVARTVCFMLSDWSDGITAEIVHVDGGFHAMGGGGLVVQSAGNGVAPERGVVDVDPLPAGQ